MRPTAEYLSSTVVRFWPGLATLLTTLAVYLLTLATDLTWANSSGDGGELITASYTLGIPHPPGYPTYTLLGKAFSLLPLGTVAWRYNLFSAIVMSLAAALATAAVVTMLKEPVANKQIERASTSTAKWKPGLTAIIAGLFFAFSPLVWQQAIVTEVYALNALFVSMVLLATVRHMVSTQRSPGRWLSFTHGLLLGLAITTHLTSLLLLPLVLVINGRRRILFVIAGLAAGLLPFLALPLLGRTNSPVIWGDPDTVRGWWWLVSGRLYQPNILALPISDWGQRLYEWCFAAARSFAWLILPIFVIGVYQLWQADRRKILFLVLPTVAFYGFYAFTYATVDAHVMFLPGVLLLSIILGFGIDSRPLLALFLLLLLVALNLSSQRLDTASSVRFPAEQLLEQVPSEAILITPGDQTIATMWYFHHVEGQRPDVIIIDGNLFQFDWYRKQIADTYPGLRHLTEDDLDGFRQQNRGLRPICELSLVNPEINHCSFKN